jgi:hypothetical protein
MEKLPDVFEVKFCSCCACMTWHTADGQCEWSNDHQSKDGRPSTPFRRWLSAAADTVTKASAA